MAVFVYRRCLLILPSLSKRGRVRRISQFYIFLLRETLCLISIRYWTLERSPSDHRVA